MSFTYKKFSPKYRKKFDQFKRNFLNLSHENFNIEHIGSTSVEGLGGKGIIDVSIGIKKWSNADSVLKILRKLGFKHFHEIENFSLFVSTKAFCEEGDFHVHISRIGTKRYNRTLAFRDHLRNHHNESKKYEKLKRGIFKICKGNRQIYKKLKNKWFNKTPY